jgi:RND superfamily putative drug exporter
VTVLAPPKRPAGGALFRLGGWSARHSWLVIGVWITLLVAATVGHTALGGTYIDNFNLPDSPALRGSTVLTQHEPGASGQGGQLVFTTSSGTLAERSSAIATAVKQVGALPHILSASDPLQSATTSKDGRTAYSSISFDTVPGLLGDGYVAKVDHAVAPARAAGVHVDYGGQLGIAARPQGSDVRSEVIGIAVAVLVLLIGFGSVYAAGLPILSAIVGVGVGLGLLGMIAAGIDFATVAPTLGAMMGLGVGMDYGLFLTTRHRQLVMDGVPPDVAAARTVASSGRAVIIAAVTVVIALLGLYASGISFVGKLGLAAGTTVTIACLSAITLVPALLGRAGRSIDKRTVRRPVAESIAVSVTDPDASSGWDAYARRVGRHPWRFLLGGLALLSVLAIPLFSIRLGHIDAGADPTSYTDRAAYDAMGAAFGKGANGPMTVVVDLDGTNTQQVTQLQQTLRTRLAATKDVASVTPIAATADRAVLTTTVIPVSGPQDAATHNLLQTLRDTALPQALSGTKATGYVTGTVAFQLDFRNKVAARLPLIIGVVIAAAFVLLLITFRSPVLALKAAILNLFSIAASYGVVVAVFQWGWGGSLVGVPEKVPVESYIPMMMFAIVFGLSMDYEVFLLSRIRESWLRTRDNHTSVATGLAATARVITCAALIITSVFLAFLLSTDVDIKMIALGLGVSILIDASIVRLVVVPATMYLLRRANWWIPAWLDRILPHLDPESESTEVPEPVTVSDPVSTDTTGHTSVPAPFQG